MKFLAVAQDWYFSYQTKDIKMNQLEAAREITTVIPKAAAELSGAGTLKSPFALIRVITNHTRKMVVQHNEIMLQKCLKLIDRIYTKGDSTIKNAIENVFIFSLDHILSTCTAPERSRVFSKVPINLYSAYIRQIYKSGI